MGYTKLFDSMWSGSLYGKFEASAVFMVMLSLSDAEGQVDMTPEAIAGRTGWPLEFIKEGIRQLEAPDIRSRTPDADGRRIILMVDGRDWGWFITNHAKYRDEMRSAERREYLKEAKRKEREKRRQQLSTSQPVSTAVNPSYAYAEAATEQTKSTTARKRAHADEEPEGFAEFRKIFPKRAGSQPWNRALKAWKARIAHGVTAEDILAGTRRYRAFVDATGKTGTEFVQQAATFLGPDENFRNLFPAPAKPETAYEEIQRLNGLNGGNHGSGRVFDTEQGKPPVGAPFGFIRG